VEKGRKAPSSYLSRGFPPSERKGRKEGVWSFLSTILWGKKKGKIFHTISLEDRLRSRGRRRKFLLGAARGKKKGEKREE